MPVVTYEAGSTVFRQGDEGNSMCILLRGSIGFYSSVGARKVFVQSMGAGRSFGELAMLWRTPRSLTVLAQEQCEIGEMSRELYQDHIVRTSVAQRDFFSQCLRNSKMLEMLGHEQIAKLADTVIKESFLAGDSIITQGEAGNCFFIMLSGESKTVVRVNNDFQEHRRYGPGDLFGERALLNDSAKREASIIAVTDVDVLAVTASKFERLIGPINALLEHYLTDPRSNIATFFAPGDKLGPRGCCADGDRCAHGEATTKWFAIYRPTSRDAIARMLSRTGVGKGLNVKGKSAKGNRLSGYVPFLQISQNDHKSKIDKPPVDGWVQVFWRTQSARDEVEKTIKAGLERGIKGLPLGSDCPMMPIDKYPDSYGLLIPEAVVHCFFIHKPDISSPVGWETGRMSEPAFMDMNLNVLRSTKADPRVVLYQADLEDSMNPHGLLMAYAEETVKPVVSDFDTFLVGSSGMEYEELVSDQVELAKWALKKTRQILEDPGSNSWTTRWLEVLKQAIQDGDLQMETPKYGFGDPTSYRIIEEIVKATKETGAVRHGSECFNFVFPQELDHEYLVIWDGFPNQWEYLDEDDMRDWLLERTKDGFSFPLNPVWAVRDIGWYEVLAALRSNITTSPILQAWYPQSLLDMVDEIHEVFPDGFEQVQNSTRERSKSVMGDLSMNEKVDLALEQVRKQAVANKVRNAAKALSCLGLARRLSRMIAEGAETSRSPSMGLPVLPIKSLESGPDNPWESEQGEPETPLHSQETPTIACPVVSLQAADDDVQSVRDPLEALETRQEDHRRSQLSIGMTFPGVVNRFPLLDTHDTQEVPSRRPSFL
jgi:CRP-like cAMP-binding protein